MAGSLLIFLVEPVGENGCDGGAGRNSGDDGYEHVARRWPANNDEDHRIRVLGLSGIKEKPRRGAAAEA